ncbi:elongation factor 2 [Quercus suber]|uniref:Elongation factor 2 n=1 Tax=Quercus suber TaxID=58331 RepID=A0AAW0IL70_QUESU
MGKYDRVDVVTALILGLSGLIVGYDTSSIDTSMLDILFEFAIDDKQSFTNSVISYFYVGAMSGGILFCFFYDFLGPRKTLIISDALFISSATCTYFSIKPSLLLVGRFFFGLGLGIATLSCPLIIFETSAIKTRGTLIACNGLMMGLGSFLSYLFDIFDSGAPNIWRIKLGIIALPALLQVLLVAVLSMFSKLSKPCVEVSYPNCVSSLFFDSNLKNALAAAIFVQACTELTGIKYLLISLFIFIHTSCVASISTVFTVEILPPPFKGFGGGITVFFQYLLGFGVSFFIENTINLLENSTVAIVFASLSTFTSLIIIFFVPESKYVSNTLPSPKPSKDLNPIHESLIIDIKSISGPQQALGERIRPVNRMDQCFLELQGDREEAYHTFRRVMCTFEDPFFGFSARLHGWASNQTNFTKMYASKFRADEVNMMELLLGEDLMGKALMKLFMKNWFPASSALLEVMIFLLPSRAANSNVRNSIAQLPFMHYGNKVLTVAVSGKRWSLYVKILQRNKVWMGKRQETIEDLPRGNTVATVGLDQYVKNAALTDEKEVVAHPIRAMKLSMSPLMCVAVQCKVASDVPKLVEGLKRLAKAYPLVVCSIEDSGVHIIAGAGEVHLDICSKDLLDDFVGGAESTRSDLGVSFPETVLEKSCRVVMSKSPNKHNCLYMEALPMEDGFAEAIDEDHVGPRDDPRGRSKILSEDFAKKIWCFGPETTGPNMLVDMCKAVQYLIEMKDSVAARKVHWLKKT